MLAASIANNDTCDIGIAPAATLLLPYFEADFQHPRGAAAQTIFTVVNVSPRTHVANVTLWTDWAYPALSFSIVLHGYGMETVDLYELFARGAMPSCSGPVPPAMLADLQSLFTTGRGAACAEQVGFAHPAAIGYATVDVVANCTAKNPSSPGYYDGTILFDNVLTGDYEHIDGASAAAGGALVHIRAIPEGDAAGTNLPYTFYDRFAKKLDRRQPLPSIFAVHYIALDSRDLYTSIAVWREADGDGSCASFRRPPQYYFGPNIAVVERLRFDEHENATLFGCCCITCPPDPGTAAAESLRVDGPQLPPAPLYADDGGGWLYLNLHDGASSRPRQGWVVAMMRMGTTYAVDVRAAALGNGCSPRVLDRRGM